MTLPGALMLRLPAEGFLAVSPFSQGFRTYSAGVKASVSHIPEALKSQSSFHTRAGTSYWITLAHPLLISVGLFYKLRLGQSLGTE